METDGRLAWAVRLAVGAAGAVFVLMVAGSRAAEILWPLWRADACGEFALNCFGLPLILAGTLVFVWGGWRFLTGSGPLVAGQR